MTNRKIEKKIPIPRPRGRPRVWKDIAESMDVGDSVQLASEKDVMNFYTCLYRIGYKASQRKQLDGSYRVWKRERI